MAAIVLNQVTKRFHNEEPPAVQKVDLEIADGEFVVLVGPSGCGKSTTLNMIAGLEDITSGELRIDGERVNEWAPKDRNLAMVFQSYALYPHMTVRENIAFPLKLARVRRSIIETQVVDTARKLDLADLLDRKPATLSGGQRQRVAMARAIVRKPRAFLMDEPLSNLDAKLRVQMQILVSQVQKDQGVTTVYVTHDQTEAMRLGDRVVVLRGGVVQQIGAPQLLYEHPANVFVAGFIGSPAMNLLPARLEHAALRCVVGELPLSDQMRRTLEAAGAPRDVILGVRPEHFEDAALVKPGIKQQGVTFTARAMMVESLGPDKYAHLALDGEQASTAELERLAAETGTADVPGATHLVTRLSGASAATQGEKVHVWFDPDHVQVFDPADGRNLTPAPGAPHVTQVHRPGTGTPG
ncbi:MAG: sn-glycerol-3-phosphate ABC transporter ATP-binding protein UgpC [Pseudonocardiales bacterium]|nr:sn-glycerol-3-phosphate ABC transporter ATP-binding protein UgpC [Pseudonocardiales bacterium]